MRDNHIIELLESRALSSLDDNERAVIKAHASSCASCKHAYEVAQVSTSLLRERASAFVEPSPFFHTRVLAALRERQNDVPAFKRLWQSAGALVSSMTATVALLAVFTFVMPAGQTSTAQASEANGYSAEEIILNQNDLQDEQASDAQVLTTLYAAEESGAK